MILRISFSAPNHVDLFSRLYAMPIDHPDIASCATHVFDICFPNPNQILVPLRPCHTKGKFTKQLWIPGLSALLGVSLIIGGILVVLLFRFAIIIYSSGSLESSSVLLIILSIYHQWSSSSFRGFVDQMIKAEIPLRAGSTVTEAWIHPPVRPLLKVDANR